MNREQDLKEAILTNGNIPRHVAIIMDGNGRWAQRQGQPRIFGHREGVNSVREIVQIAGDIGVEYLTLYTFSKENWKRPKDEVSSLMNLLSVTVKKEAVELNRNNVRLNILGDINDLPERTRKRILSSIDLLHSNTGLTLNLALSYSSRLEILTAVKNVVNAVSAGELNLDELDEQRFSTFLYTKTMPDPDLVIRTSGEQRISNFLLWQIAYAEIFVSDTLWPEFRRLKFLEAIEAFQHRERRFGGVITKST